MKRFFILFILLLIPAFVNAEAMQIDFLLSGMRDPLTDEPLAGGKVYTYEAGAGEVEKNLYTDRDATTDATNPIILDAYGRAIVFGNDIYRFIVKNASDTIVWSSDGLEYKATAGSSSQAALTENLDANGFKIINLAAGADNEDSTTYAQLQSVRSELLSDISDVQDSVDAKTFTSLTDTPSNYSGSSGKIPIVGSSAVSLEFRTADEIIASSSYASQNFLNLDDTPTSYSGYSGQGIVVNAGETGLTFAPAGGVPVGTIVMFAGSVIPTGWNVCDGSSFLIANYPDLAAALGSTWNHASTPLSSVSVPDLRGMFVKGVGTNAYSGIVTAGGAAYSGSTLGSYITDKFQGHDHNAGIFWSGGAYGGAAGSSGIPATPKTQGVTSDAAGSYGAPRVSTITEPAHAALYYIIRVE